MTRKEIELAKQNLNKRIREAIGQDNLVGWKKVLKEKGLLRELYVFENEDNELSAREMINCNLCYGEDYFKPIERWIFEKQAHGIKSYAEEDAEAIVGGMTRVREIFEEQKADFEQATVIRNAHTDSEGLSYSTIVWADERAEEGEVEG